MKVKMYRRKPSNHWRPWRPSPRTQEVTADMGLRTGSARECFTAEHEQPRAGEHRAWHSHVCEDKEWLLQGVPSWATSRTAPGLSRGAGVRV